MLRGLCSHDEDSDLPWICLRMRQSCTELTGREVRLALKYTDVHLTPSTDVNCKAVENIVLRIRRIIVHQAAQSMSASHHLSRYS